MTTEWRGYFYIEDLGLTAQQRQTLVDTFKAWGLRNVSAQPHERNHWHVRPDGKAVIFEAVFDADNMTVLWVRTKLAEIFSVSLASVTATTTTTEYGPLLTFRYNSVDRLRLGIFAGLAGSWLQSRAAAAHFLADNFTGWNSGL